jgi:hypothetical protein
MIDHDVPPGTDLAPPPPLAPVAAGRRRSPAEEARTLVGSNSAGALGTLCSDGHPWASLVTYGALADGSPVLLVSQLAEHGRNLARDGRASLMVAHDLADAEPLAHGRVTLVCDGERATGELEAPAREAHIAAIPSAAMYEGFGDFTLWVLRVRRIRWVGGYGRMDSVDADAFTAASPDPTAPAAAGAIRHLNTDHADALLAIGQALGGYRDATGATCTAIDRYGLDLTLQTPRGRAPSRVGFAVPAARAEDLRAATVELTARSRKMLALG